MPCLGPAAPAAAGEGEGGRGACKFAFVYSLPNFVKRSQSYAVKNLAVRKVIKHQVLEIVPLLTGVVGRLPGICHQIKRAMA